MKAKTIKIYILIFGMFLTIPCISNGQTLTRKLTLEQVISLAQTQSPDALNAKHRFKSSYWQYRTYSAGLLPALTFNGTLPNYNHSIDRITLSDGSDAFINRSLSNYSASMALTQNLKLTGGQIFLNSDVERIDIFGDSTQTSFLTSPLNIGIRQPLFAYNDYRWAKKIEPRRYNEAERRYEEDLEQVTITAIDYFFELLNAQIAYQIQKTNQANNDTLYQIGKGRYNIGTIAENELLQLELSQLTSNAELETAALDLETKVFDLKSFLRIKDNEPLEIIPPAGITSLMIDTQKAISEARSNRADILAFERRILEAESSVNKAKLENRFSANLYAVYGLTQSSARLREAYKNPQEQQQLTVGIQIPILDWGLGKGKVKMAESNLELERTSVEQQMTDFDQQVYLKVSQFNIQKNQLRIAAKSDTVAQKRYEVTKQRYLIGKIDIIELNIAQTEKDNARRGYFSALHNFWKNYYEIRKQTLFDFSRNQPIRFDINQITNLK